MKQKNRSSRSWTTKPVNNIRQLESNSFNGIAVIKVFLQPSAKVEGVIAKITSACGTVLQALPPGTTLVMRGQVQSM